MNLAVVVPTIRLESLEQFLKAWRAEFETHQPAVIIVRDGKVPQVEHLGHITEPLNLTAEQHKLFYRWNDGIRNLGFYYVAKHLPGIDVILTLDDDVEPCGRTILDHLEALDKRVPISWMSTASEFTRGFPYGVREEAQVWVSHGGWLGVPDFDAPSQLVNGIHPVSFYQGAIPKGVLAPICGMNLAFRREALPFMYFAPMGPEVGIHRFADIWMGIRMKRELDKLGRAVVTGYAMVKHQRASNVFKNLEQEGKGIRLNETWWQGDERDPYFKLYNQRYAAWQKLIANV